MPKELWTEVCGTVQETGIKTIPKKKKCEKARWLSGEALQIAVKRREVKSKGEKERYKHLNAEFQRIAKRDKKAFLSNQCKEIKENNRMGKTRDLFKKIRDIKGTFHTKMDSIKDRNGMDLTEAEDIKKMWQEYTEQLYKKDLHNPDNHNGVITHLEPDIMKSEVKWALGSIGNDLICAVDCRNATESEVNGTLQAHEGGGTSYNLNNVCRERYIVRRLTPTECERLQGYPDGWTDIGEWTDTKGKKHKPADSPRYKSIGNSIAIPPWLFVLSRLNEYCEEKTMASLFDGIGGFPLIWEFLNGTGSAVWCSEIEEFPIAVTKLRFPDKESEYSDTV